MGRRQARRLRPTLDSLEIRQVLSATSALPLVHAAVAPIAIPIATFNNTFTQINNAFQAYEGPYDDTINAIGQFASSLVSAVISPGSANDPNGASISGDSYVAGSKGDAVALENRLRTAIGKLPGGQREAPILINQAFESGGLTTTNAGYFRGTVRTVVRHYVSQGIKRGEFVLVWPGQHR